MKIGFEIFWWYVYVRIDGLVVRLQLEKCNLCASAAETRFSVTAKSKEMLYIPLQRNTM